MINALIQLESLTIELKILHDTIKKTYGALTPAERCHPSLTMEIAGIKVKIREIQSEIHKLMGRLYTETLRCSSIERDKLMAANSIAGNDITNLIED